MTLRQDAWSDQDDRLLATTVLKHIKEGSTQLKAFDETGDLLDRTSAACGFRWNAIVRQDYEQDVKEAKRERKRKMRLSAKRAADQINPTPVVSSPSSLEGVITQLEQLTSQLDQEENLEDTEKTIQELQKENMILHQEINRVKQEYETMRHDYDTIVTMMNRARELAVTEETALSPYAFKMEQNGNLEKIN
ncbi:RsfA family transcriptional regulator [Alteribacillus iranensis]|uniref:Prespore-specific regulator n=1 Tax=Alteribacillus iranensis TaxID=930128 RepID=A0A1I1ZB06_9BACI|nr:RsfA family transcriptional regulator [Alteribacillus iranensis]SFE27520.1 prespore-specific regulator [Alteribacillus iranensis]